MGRNVKIGERTINLDKVIVKHKSVNDFITELEPNINNIIRYARINGVLPFQGKRHKLKEWLISNQQGYNKYEPNIYHYFLNVCKI